jgi:hypothetical protein
MWLALDGGFGWPGDSWRFEYADFVCALSRQARVLLFVYSVRQATMRPYFLKRVTPRADVTVLDPLS